MAKRSMIAREKKRIETVRRFAEKRAGLKAILADTRASSEEKDVAVRCASAIDAGLPVDPTGSIESSDLPAISCEKQLCAATCRDS
jgi:hypothetical protein